MVAWQPKSMEIQNSVFDNYQQIVLLWQQFISDSIQDMHLDIKHNEIVIGNNTYWILFVLK